MENCSASIINAFDALFTNNKIQMLKVLISHLPSENQGPFAVYIKFMELQHTFTFIRQHPGMRLFGNTTELSFDFFSDDNTGTLSLLEELLPFAGPDEQHKIKGMMSMLQNMKQMREMMEMIQMMQEMFPEGMRMGGMNNGEDSSSPMDMFSAMSSMMGGGTGSPLDIFSAMNMMNELKDSDKSSG